MKFNTGLTLAVWGGTLLGIGLGTYLRGGPVVQEMLTGLLYMCLGYGVACGCLAWVKAHKKDDNDEG